MVISKNDMDFEPKYDQDPETDSCSIQWRISQVGCWTDYYWDPMWQKMEKNKIPKPLGEPNQYPIGRGYTIYEPCDTTICCARQLEVCRYDDSTVTIQDLGPLSDGVDCDTVFYDQLYWPFAHLQCYNVCDYLESFDELYPRIPLINEPEKKDTVFLDEMKTIVDNFIIVYYTQTSLTIFLDNSDESNIDVAIYNYTGKLTTNKTQKLMSGRSLIEVDLSSLISGVYVYCIISNGILVKTGKFYIIR